MTPLHPIVDRLRDRARRRSRLSNQNSPLMRRVSVGLLSNLIVATRISTTFDRAIVGPR
jgi:hypothetical protein